MLKVMPPIRYTCDICKKEFRSGERLHRHLKTLQCAKSSLLSNLKTVKQQGGVEEECCESYELEYGCGLCDEKFTDGASLELHISSRSCNPAADIPSSHSEDQVTFTCGICQENFKSDTSLSAHIELEHSSLVLQCFEESHVEDNVEYTCGKCNTIFQSAASLENHVRAVVCDTTSVYSCGICSQAFPTSGELILHVQNVCGAMSNTSPVYTCGVCKQTFPTAGVLIKHMQIVCGSLNSTSGKDLGISSTRQTGANANHQHLTLLPGSNSRCKVKAVTSNTVKPRTNTKDIVLSDICNFDNENAKTVAGVRGRKKKREASKPKTMINARAGKDVGKKHSVTKLRTRTKVCYYESEDEDEVNGYSDESNDDIAKKVQERSRGCIEKKNNSEIRMLSIPEGLQISSVEESGTVTMGINTVPLVQSQGSDGTYQYLYKNTSPALSDTNILLTGNTLLHAQSQQGKTQQIIPTQSGLYSIKNPVQSGMTFISRPSQLGVLVRHGQAQPGLYSVARQNQPGSYLNVRLDQPGIYSGARPTQTGLDSGARPTPTGLYSGARPTQTGIYSGARPTPTGLDLGARPTQSDIYSGTRPTQTGLDSANVLPRPGLYPRARPTQPGLYPGDRSIRFGLNAGVGPTHSDLVLAITPTQLGSVQRDRSVTTQSVLDARSTQLVRPLKPAIISSIKPQQTTVVSSTELPQINGMVTRVTESASPSEIPPVSKITQPNKTLAYKLHAQCPVCKQPGELNNGKFTCHSCRTIFSSLSCARCLKSDFADYNEFQGHLINSCNSKSQNMTTTNIIDTVTSSQNITQKTLQDNDHGRGKQSSVTFGTSSSHSVNVPVAEKTQSFEQDVKDTFVGCKETKMIKKDPSQEKMDAPVRTLNADGAYTIVSSTPFIIVTESINKTDTVVKVENGSQSALEILDTVSAKDSADSITSSSKEQLMVDCVKIEKDEKKGNEHECLKPVKNMQKDIILDAEKMKICVNKLRNFVQQHADQLKSVKPVLISDTRTAVEKSITHPVMTSDKSTKEDTGNITFTRTNNSLKLIKNTLSKEKIEDSNKNENQIGYLVKINTDEKEEASKKNESELENSQDSHVYINEIPALFNAGSCDSISDISSGSKCKRVNVENENQSESSELLSDENLADESDSESDISDQSGYEEIMIDELLHELRDVAEKEENKTQQRDIAINVVSSEDATENIIDPSVRKKATDNVSKSKEIIRKTNSEEFKNISSTPSGEHSKVLRSYASKLSTQKTLKENQTLTEYDSSSRNIARKKDRNTKLNQKRITTKKELRIELHDLGSLKQKRESKRGKRTRQKTVDIVIETDSDSEPDVGKNCIRSVKPNTSVTAHSERNIHSTNECNMQKKIPIKKNGMEKSKRKRKGESHPEAKPAKISKPYSSQENQATEKSETLHDSSPDLYECGDCELKFDSLQLLTSHMQAHKSSSEKHGNSSNYNSNTVEKTDFCCYKCSVTFSSEKDFIIHLKTHEKVQPPVISKDEFVCGLCSKIFYSLSFLQSHLLLHQNLVEEFLCGICQTSFTSASELENHIKSHFKMYDNKTGSKETNLKSKVESVISNKCSNCEQVFSDKVDLDVHCIQCKSTNLTTLDDISYKCGKCSETFKNILKLHLHKNCCKNTNSMPVSNVKMAIADTTNTKTDKNPVGKMCKLLNYKPASAVIN